MSCDFEYSENFKLLKSREVLDSKLSGHRNNFDFIRFIAATMVLFSHSWPLTTGSNVHEPLAIVTTYQLDFGSLSVDIFFVVSGFLVTQSFDRSKDVLKFAKSRFLRIVPALMAVIVLLGLVVGPITTTVSAHEYFAQFPFPSFVRDHLPGVFVGNPFPAAVDGSLWTIKYEILCYVMVALLGVLSLLSNRYTILGLWVFAMTPIGYHYSLGLLPFFTTGMLFYTFRRNIHITGVTSLALFCLAILSIVTHLSHWVIPISLGYLVIWFAYTSRLRLEHFAKYGDWSYGIYIYAFPVQQLFVEYAGIRNPFLLFVLALPVTLVLSGISWHLIEKRALRLKNVSIALWLTDNNQLP